MTVKSIKVLKGKRIKNYKGDIIKFISKKDKVFKKFGEIYFSEIKKNKTKGWNFHKRYTCLLIVPFGKVEFLIANRLLKKTKKIILSDKNCKILQIPPKYWFCFRSLVKKSIIANILDNVHNSNETKKSNMIQSIKIK
tara:strand:+ start:4854 stop:5267 length:414 start_codon:yes stop_codon:yes gene_type:complete